jgi:hypothetical protein
LPSCTFMAFRSYQNPKKQFLLQSC